MLTLESALVAARHEEFGPMPWSRQTAEHSRFGLTALVNAAQANGRARSFSRALVCAGRACCWQRFRV